MTPISLGIIAVGTAGTPVSITINSAAVIGWNPGTGPLIIVASVNDTVKITVDGGSPQTLTLTAGSFSKDQLVSQLNAQISGATASLTSRGNFMLASNTHTASSSLLLDTVANSAYATLGLATGSYNSMPDTVGCKLEFRPLPTNAGNVYVGNAHNFSKTSGLGLLDILIPQLASSPTFVDRFSITAHENENTLHTEHYWIDVDTNGEGVVGVLWVN